MKILHVIPTLKKGGAERLVIDICTSLKRQNGVDVQLLCFSSENEYATITKDIEINYLPAWVVPSIFKKDNINIEQYINFIKAFKPDIIHSHLFEAEMVSRYSTDPRIVYVSHLHGNMPQFENFHFSGLCNKKSITNYYEKQLLTSKYKACNNHFIAISKHTKEYFTKNLSYSLSKNIALLHNAIDYGRFYNPLLAPPFSQINLVSVGSLVDNKNHEFLIDVMKVLREKDINVHLSILGEGENRQKILNKINEYQLQDRIQLHGNVDAVEHYLHQANIYVHSAIYESFGLVFLEAMASGLPVVALDASGNRDIIENGKNGYLLEKADAVLFAEKIISLISNKELYKTLSKQAISFSKEFDISVYVDKLMNYYTLWLNNKVSR